MHLDIYGFELIDNIVLLVIGNDSSNESLMPEIFVLSLISVNPRLKASCSDVQDLLHLTLSVLLRRGFLIDCL